MKVFFEEGKNTGHGLRGIGVHTKELIKAFQDTITLDKDKADIIHFTYFKPFEKTIVPFFKTKNQKWILTIHDLIPLIYPKHYPSGIKGRIIFLINSLIIKKNIDSFITISETSKKDIVRLLKINPRKIHVVYLAPKSIFKKDKVMSKYALPNKFALYVGDVNYNKNIPNLVKACDIAGIKLVIAGSQIAEIEQMDLNHPELIHLKEVDFKNVIRLGFVDDSTLKDLYNLAAVYIQPSFYEGFGLPLVEAYSCGTSLAVAKTQALVEILGKDFKYFDPNNLKDMVKSILKPNRKNKIVRNYSWRKCFEETLDVYNETLKK